MGRFHRRHHHHHYKLTTFQRYVRFARHHPIIASGLSTIVGIILIRLSFIETLFKGEIRFWVLFVGIVLLLVAFVSFLIWVKRNVPMFYSKHDVNWRNR